MVINTVIKASLHFDSARVRNCKVFHQKKLEGAMLLEADSTTFLLSLSFSFLSLSDGGGWETKAICY